MLTLLLTPRVFRRVHRCPLQRDASVVRGGCAGPGFESPWGRQPSPRLRLAGQPRRVESRTAGMRIAAHGDRGGAPARGFDDRSAAQGEGATRSVECGAPRAVGPSQSPLVRRSPGEGGWGRPPSPRPRRAGQPREDVSAERAILHTLLSPGRIFCAGRGRILGWPTPKAIPGA